MYIDHRLVKIIDELLVFVAGYNADDIDINIKKEKNVSTVTMKAKLNQKIESKKLDKVKKLLSAPRQHEMEEYYWGLTGNDTTPSCELALIGMMTDAHELKYDEAENTIYIKIIRYR